MDEADRQTRKQRIDTRLRGLNPPWEMIPYLRREITWAEFSRRYQAELLQNPPLDRGNQTIKNRGQKFTLRLLKALAIDGVHGVLDLLRFPGARLRQRSLDLSDRAHGP